ncbi:MAG: hypothetical protein WAN48_15755 [Actinomycetes bacterium]
MDALAQAAPNRRQPRRGDTATALLRRSRSVTLAMAGLSYDEIAREVGYANRGTAWRTVTKALEQKVADSVDELRQVEGERLDALQAAVWGQALAGDVAACTAVLKIIDRRIQLFGLNQASTTTPDKGSSVLIGSTVE